jgi:integrase
MITFIDTAVNAAKPVDERRTEYRLRDTKGYPMDRLVLEIQPATGAAKKPKRIWRVHYDLKQRDGRVYSHDEIYLIWRQIDWGPLIGIWAQFRAVVQLGFLTGQRLREYTGAQRDELDLGGDRPVWRISSQRVKNKRPHNIPLPPKSVEIFARVLKVAEQQSPFVFPSTAKLSVPFHSDTAGHMFGALAEDLSLSGGAVFHAIRHTVRTELGDLGISREISERILNHRNPTSDISTRYDHGEYYREQYDALHAWEHRLMAIVSGRNT